MTIRRYSPRCANCHQKAMAIAMVPYQIRIDHDGRKYDVRIPALSVPQCTECKAISIDQAASEQIDNEFHKVANLLTADEILRLRREINLTQKELAKLMGISDAT